MNAEIESLYQEIGQETLAFVEDLQGRLLVYAEVEDATYSCNLFYEKGNERIVTHKFMPRELGDLVYSLWEKWKDMGLTEWRALSYFIAEDGKFDIDIKYPDQINLNEGKLPRRAKVIENYFGDVKVDYSNP